jgi:Heterokaryon incompatibility protein (HET)
MSEYLYEGLEKGQIRLVTLSWAPEDDPLSASLTAVQLKDSEAYYSALSYVWGSEEKPRILRIDNTDQTISITESAYLALRWLRLNYTSCEQPFVVWVDAICINQEDDEDKNQQVTMMADIYACASKIYAYLGEEADNSHEALHLLKGLRAKHTDAFATFNNTLESRLLRWMESPVPNEIVSAMGALREDPDRLSVLVALRVLLFRSWFDRIWIVQEVVLAKEVLLICGRQVISLEDLLFAFLVIKDEPNLEAELYAANGTDSAAFTPRVALLYTLHTSRVQRQTETISKIPLIVQLSSFSRHASTRARDRVYALLGLSSDRESLTAHGFTVRYDTPFETVVRSCAVSLILEYGLVMLYCAGLGSQPNRFPSFSCDWTIPFDQWAFILVNSDNVYSSTTGSTAAWRIEDTCSNPVLCARSKCVDEIVWVGREHALDSTHDPVLQWACAINDCVAPLHEYPTGQALREVGWRTAISNWNYTAPQSSYPAQLHDSYTAFRTTAQLDHDKVFDGHKAEHLSLLRSASPFLSALGAAVQASRKLCRTSKGYIALVPERTEVGDKIYLIYGLPVPFVIRPHPADKSISRLVGSCYVHGIMDGEAMAWETEEEDLKII